MLLEEAKQILNHNGYRLVETKIELNKTPDEVETIVIKKLKEFGFSTPDWFGDEHGVEWSSELNIGKYRIEVYNRNTKYYTLNVLDNFVEIDLKVPGVRKFDKNKYGNGYRWTSYEKLLADTLKTLEYIKTL